MRDSTDGVEEAVDVLLTGGPASLAADRRLRVPAAEHKIKVPHLGGYEHFERTDEVSGAVDTVRVYRWTMRTQIAE